MSSLRLPLTLALLCCLQPRPLSAQSAGATRTELSRLTRRRDSLAALWREADAVADLVDSLAHRPPPVHLDSMRIGGLSIIATNAPMHLRQAAESAWRVLDGFYGTSAGVLAEHPYRIAGLDSGQLATDAEGQWGNQVPRELPLDLLTHFLISSSRIGEPDTDLRLWLDDAARPTQDTNAALMGVYTDLVTSPFSVAHGCLLGDMDHCASALDLDAEVEALTRRYPAPEDRRLLISLLQSYAENAGEKALARGCLDGADTSCIALLQTFPITARRPPLARAARQALVQLAVITGGREAYQRLVGSAGQPMTERLALTATEPIDSLVAQWRAQVFRHRPEPVAVPFGVVSAGLGWIFIFGLCGLGSSRWRAG